MSLPAVTLTWDISKINQRRTFTSVNDEMGFTFFTFWRYLIDTMGWTVKYTCDGTTGPASSSDHTDRLTSIANCSHRGISTAVASSWGVATDGGGADHLFAYVGAGTSPTGDNLFYAAFSPTGAYVPAATAADPATATDQVLVSNTLNWVGTGASDCVVSMQASTDKKNFRLWVYKAGALQVEYFIERCSSTVISSLNWTDPLVVGVPSALAGTIAFNTNGSSISAPNGTQGASGNAWAKIAGIVVNVGGGCEGYLGSTRLNSGVNCFLTANCELNGGGPIVPTVFASTTTFAEGKVGNRVDSWFAFINGITDNTWFGTNYNYMYINTRVVPWDGANPLIIA